MPIGRRPEVRRSSMSTRQRSESTWDSSTGGHATSRRGQRGRSRSTREPGGAFARAAARYRGGPGYGAYRWALKLAEVVCVGRHRHLDLVVQSASGRRVSGALWTRRLRQRQRRPGAPTVVSSSPLLCSVAGRLALAALLLLVHCPVGAGAVPRAHSRQGSGSSVRRGRLAVMAGEAFRVSDTSCSAGVVECFGDSGCAEGGGAEVAADGALGELAVDFAGDCGSVDGVAVGAGIR